jgi:hypothetical protein
MVPHRRPTELDKGMRLPERPSVAHRRKRMKPSLSHRGKRMRDPELIETALVHRFSYYIYWYLCEAVLDLGCECLFFCETVLRHCV